MDVKKIKGNTYIIDTGMSYLAFYKINETEIIMIDTGWPDELEGIIQVFETHHLKPVAIIGTHAHADHIGNNAKLKEKYGCVIAMPKEEANNCSSLMNLKMYYNTQTQSLSDIKAHYGYMVCETDIHLFKEQQSVYLNGVKFKLFPAPGHSMALTCVITPDDVAYLADALISKEVMEGYKLPFSFVLEQDLQSKQALKNLKCSYYIVTHKKVYQDISGLIEENIDFYKTKAENVYGLITKHMTMEDILKAVVKAYDIHISTVYKYNVVFRMLRCYVEYLHETGRIKQIVDDGFVKYARC